MIRRWPPHGGEPSRLAGRQVDLARLSQPAVREALLPKARASHVAITIVTELEVGFSARSAATTGPPGNPCRASSFRCWCRQERNNDPGEVQAPSSRRAI